MRVRKHFLLHDNRPLVLVHVLDWVFDRENFAASLAINEVHEIVQRGRFPGTSWTCDENKPAGFTSQVINLLRQAQFFAIANPVAAKTNAEFRTGVAAVKRGANASRDSVGQRNTQFP